MIEHGDYTDFEVLADGNLEISLTEKGREELSYMKELHDDWNDYEVLIDLIDCQLCNGWFILTPESLGVLTDSIILSNDVNFDDDGEVTWAESSWWYPNYQIVNLTDELEKTGRLIFAKA